jgi:hypothetical protein
VIVHDIEVHHVGTGSEDVIHLLAQSRKIGRQDGGSNQVVIGTHGAIISEFISRIKYPCNWPLWRGIVF